jgi:hypothetical protein
MILLSNIPVKHPHLRYEIDFQKPKKIESFIDWLKDFNIRTFEKLNKNDIIQNNYTSVIDDCLDEVSYNTKFNELYETIKLMKVEHKNNFSYTILMEKFDHKKLKSVSQLNFNLKSSVEKEFEKSHSYSNTTQLFLTEYTDIKQFEHYSNFPKNLRILINDNFYKFDGLRPADFKNSCTKDSDKLIKKLRNLQSGIIWQYSNVGSEYKVELSDYNYGKFIGGEFNSTFKFTTWGNSYELDEFDIKPIKELFNNLKDFSLQTLNDYDFENQRLYDTKGEYKWNGSFGFFKWAFQKFLYEEFLLDKELSNFKDDFKYWIIGIAPREKFAYIPFITKEKVSTNSDTSLF